ncbi:Mor transcription activator family protein [Clostridium perfringens]|uniref:Mor transcription activator family protein n=1 Tax=Clostridium perfringens TaxID=1502 RepID=UPI00103D64D9|nr:Mor transcription activator family protein [Clostridium perfringens]EGT0000599.1 Mor transcription activator family protein [Clostridium perfringens]MBI6003864.1 Mor transcription activator family protein [Clostridium perfringens]MBI6065836.1 Mor transcription activator family protein [Clostridium perfringens]MBI6111940.1 Mor transcription activator family protein [Clostridium perfringens]MBI6114970.1 Mor transcription activator family protein [Clostridium perfringens]
MKRRSDNYSGIYKDMVEILGEEITLKIYENYKGQQVTFPMRLYSKSYIIEYLIKNYNGKNLKELSRQLGYTSNWLQQVIKKTNIKEKVKSDMEENKNVL